MCQAQAGSQSMAYSGKRDPTMEPQSPRAQKLLWSEGKILFWLSGRSEPFICPELIFQHAVHNSGIRRWWHQDISCAWNERGKNNIDPEKANGQASGTQKTLTGILRDGRGTARKPRNRTTGFHRNNIRRAC